MANKLSEMLMSAVLSTPGTRKATEVLERSIQWWFIAVVVIAEAVTGFRVKNAVYPNPWAGFSWTGEAELEMFATRHAQPPRCYGDYSTVS